MARKKSDAETVAAILAKFNIQTDEPIDVPETNYNHRNAVAMFGKVPQYFVLGECRQCKESFAHNQPIPAGTRVGYCSDACRKKAFEADTAIKWEAVVSPRREPWDGDPPMIITPEQLRNLRNIADWFTRNQTNLEIQSPEPEPLADLEDSLESTGPEDQSLYYDSGEALISELESLHLVGAPTSPLPEPYLSEPEQTDEVDDPFDF